MQIELERLNHLTGCRNVRNYEARIGLRRARVTTNKPLPVGASVCMRAEITKGYCLLTIGTVTSSGAHRFIIRYENMDEFEQSELRAILRGGGIE